ncbi:methylated-DNA--[protein]-cysteine S-methyltransferase [Streptacidiphilus sp. P02-A3a]|uniref:methylated-DNA--[protein]-cysteine S-methyltransferase n=1 Tax=Streptacidiphilus sp. P02-A3a TaxID=2704468 RepID=UPI0015F9123A|nr:methylated-DNA--[protein]-cysteine S-methyltransferase [Streptacidiphilus sp. P02-A3a]QMU71561.1 methylated-DNA--[protein]-cysteine S-methyltransferase [Streptacidiphilus sp. P02-A3a]
MIVHTTVESPLGDLLLVGEESAAARGGVALASVSMTGQRNAAVVRPEWRRAPEAFTRVAEQLEAYFDGALTEFDLDHAVRGTEFQQRVWEALEGIRYGTTTSYGRLGEQLDLERAEVRALGAAIGANPLLVVRPCHRVIGADGTMKGYAGGVERKEFLLIHEGALQPQLL